MKLSSFTWILALALVGLAACTGFPDGPAISFRSLDELIATTWSVKDAVRANTDISAQYADDYQTFRDGGDYRYFDAERTISLPPFTQDTTIAIEGVGEWRFVNGKSQVELLYSFEYEDPYNPDVTYREEVNQLWTVARLTTGELWLEDDSTVLKLEYYTQ
ncbi:MAG: hypothetical protein NWR72_14440 [Bacteroidia bacterium]|nr:hypothetical protein [Bacteroidia bacterium]